VTGRGKHAQVDRTWDWWLLYLLVTVRILFYFSFNSQKVVRRPQHFHFTFIVSLDNITTF